MKPELMDSCGVVWVKASWQRTELWSNTPDISQGNLTLSILQKDFQPSHISREVSVNKHYGNTARIGHRGWTERISGTLYII